ncbi:MAG: Hsp20/alpha crystallin family protein [Thermoplasmata archaeon]
MTTEIVPTESPFGWSEIDQMFENARRQMLDAFGIRPAFAIGIPTFPLGGVRTPRMDLEETPGTYRLSVEIPGVPKDKVSVSIRSNVVAIRGSVSAQKEEKNASYLRRERDEAEFFRSIELPEPVIAEKATAKMEHGVLHLELPKQNPEPETAEVKVPVQ